MPPIKQAVKGSSMIGIAGLFMTVKKIVCATTQITVLIKKPRPKEHGDSSIYFGADGAGQYLLGRQRRFY